jgi:hypothetical protein
MHARNARLSTSRQAVAIASLAILLLTLGGAVLAQDAVALARLAEPHVPSQRPVRLIGSRKLAESPRR